MKNYDELLALITQRGVHAEFGDAGEGWGIEQNPHELATFLVRMQVLGVQSVLEIGTGYKGGLSRFLAADMGWAVTSVDVQDYGHTFEGVEYFVMKENLHFFEWRKRRFDLVFIDGNHDYDAVMFDYEFWGDLATKAIAFHDIAGLRNCEGVQRFFGMLKATVQTNSLGVVLGVNPVDIWPLANEIKGLGNHVTTPCLEVIDIDSKYAGIGWMEVGDSGRFVL